MGAILEGRIVLRRGAVDKTGPTLAAAVKSHSSAVRNSSHLVVFKHVAVFESRFVLSTNSQGPDLLGRKHEARASCFLLRTGMPCRAGGGPAGGGH